MPVIGRVSWLQRHTRSGLSRARALPARRALCPADKQCFFNGHSVVN